MVYILVCMFRGESAKSRWITCRYFPYSRIYYIYKYTYIYNVIWKYKYINACIVHVAIIYICFVYVYLIVSWYAHLFVFSTYFVYFLSISFVLYFIYVNLHLLTDYMQSSVLLYWAKMVSLGKFGSKYLTWR